MPVLEAFNIYKSFGDNEVLKGISLVVEEGEVVAIIGPSGSGKSTLLRCLTHLEEADCGDITICDRPLEEHGYAVLSKIGLVFQNFNLFPHFSVLRNITEAQIHVLKRTRAEARYHALELLRKMDLEEKANAYPCELSGGQQQRVSIARAMALDPAILFFDEPTSALDPELTGEILRVIKQLASENMTMVIVTHEMKFACDAADRIIFMDKGVVVEEGTPDQVFRNTANVRTKQFLAGYNS